jgi:hypothetical protein
MLVAMQRYNFCKEENGWWWLVVGCWLLGGGCWNKQKSTTFEMFADLSSVAEHGSNGENTIIPIQTFQ